MGKRFLQGNQRFMFSENETAGSPRRKWNRRKEKTTPGGRGLERVFCSDQLEQIPQELVIDVMMVLHFGRLYECAQ